MAHMTTLQYVNMANMVPNIVFAACHSFLYMCSQSLIHAHATLITQLSQYL